MPFNSVLLVEYVDGENWLLTAPLVYTDTKMNKAVEVPAGFITDFASVPRGMWNLYPKVGLYAPAAVVHDFMYRYGIYTRKIADDMFLHGMEDLKVSWLVRHTMHKAVRLFGRGNYK